MAPYFIEPKCVYFIRLCGPAHAIKIGLCEVKTLRSRITCAQSQVPFKVEAIGAIEGKRPLERELHRRCIAEHIRGEWFNDCPSVREVINQALREHPNVSLPVIKPFDRLWRFKLPASLTPETSIEAA